MQPPSRPSLPAWVLAILSLPCAGFGVAASTAAADSPLELTVGYDYLRGNAPPGSCGCFSLNGGYGALAYRLPDGFSAVGEASFSTANGILGTRRNLTVDNYLLGPRYSLPEVFPGLSPYVQLLLGVSNAHATNSSIHNATGFAFDAAAGLSLRLTEHFSWNAIQIGWLRSQLNNSVNDYQNDLDLSTGLSFRF